ncbi:MAG TPA: hypothetical protein VLL54_15840 [Pyrinomonadaceae bacterium]|nr:hypothetical protein [Pyrinomonadaceae bacterium]
MKFMLALFCLFLLTAAATAQSNGDTCHVYVIDVKNTEQFRKTADFDEFVKKSKQEQEAIMKAAAVGKTYDEFVTDVGEEHLTTKTFPFPTGKQVITASVFYTDESMRSSNHQDSILLGISVGAKAASDALSEPDAAIAEISYDDNTDTVRVKRSMLVNSRRYVVGLECRCKSHPHEKN